MARKLTPYEAELSQYLGAFMILVSSIGILFNFTAFFRFMSGEKTSFYLMCISKTISNSIVLLCFLIYNGFSALFTKLLFTMRINRVANQAVCYGIYTLGPLTQLLITVNRFYVVWYSPMHISKYSILLTALGLLISWVIAIYLSFLWGFPGNCLQELKLPPDWALSSCENRTVNRFIYHYIEIITFVALTSNAMNFLMAGRLVERSKTAHLSSEAAKKRHKATVRLFTQSFIQDWIYILDLTNSIFIRKMVNSHLMKFLTTLGSDMVAHVADGLVMLVFNIQGKPKKLSRASVVTVVSSRSSDF